MRRRMGTGEIRFSSSLVGKLVSGPTQGSSRSSGPGGPAHPSCSNDTPDPINISYHSDRLFMPCYTLHMLFIWQVVHGTLNRKLRVHFGCLGRFSWDVDQKRGTTTLVTNLTKVVCAHHKLTFSGPVTRYNMQNCSVHPAPLHVT